MESKNTSEILSELMNFTKGKPVKATPEETRQIQELEEFQKRSEEDRERMLKVNAERKREEAILTQARGEVEAMRDS
jgi:large subunit ribosomal protein MRP49